MKVLWMFMLLPLAACGQSKPEKTMNLQMINHHVAKKTIEALQSGNKKAWLACFASDVVLLDDGREISFQRFSDSAIGHEYFVAIDKVENGGLSIYGRFHSDTWGDFKTYFKFTLNDNDSISVLEIGQADY